MFQFKTGVEGQDVRGPNGSFWISPQRDIAYIFPMQIRKAVQLIWEYPQCSTSKAYLDEFCETDEPTEEQLQEFKDAVDRIARDLLPMIIAPGKAHKENNRSLGLKEAGEQTGYLDMYRDMITNKKKRLAFSALSATLFNIMMCDYYKGVDEGFSGQHKPFLFCHPLEIEDDLKMRDKIRGYELD